MSDEDARQRINAEDARAALISDLATADATTFGGSWYDGATGTQHLQATTAEAADRYAGLAADKGIKTKVHQVEFTQRDLTADMNRLLAGTHPVLGNAARGHAGIDVQANRVVVQPTDADLAGLQGRRASIPDSIAVQPREKDLDVVADACPSRAHCDRPLRSGLEQWKGEQDNRTCSLGFTARDTVNPGRKYVITAGHCGGIGDTFGHYTHEFGKVEEHQNSGDVDALAIRISNPYWLNASFGWIYRPNGDGEPPFAVNARIDSESAMQAGQTVCLTARNSSAGNRCGVLDAVNSSHRGMARVSGLDACRGDSGGGWYRKSDDRRTAYGIHSDSSDGCHTADGVSYFSTLPAVRDALGKEVEIRIS
ncbi:hypothetical protein DMB38_07720 [Streptomyces sp. WAC 06738]|nr:hypothetical protein DMB38_07720 [Streptomyces sp. WAC 06738]